MEENVSKINEASMLHFIHKDRERGKVGIIGSHSGEQRAEEALPLWRDCSLDASFINVNQSFGDWRREVLAVLRFQDGGER